MQIMIFFDTNKYFDSKNMIFHKTNSHILITIPNFFQIIVDFTIIIAHFFSSIVNFSDLIDNFLVDNSQNPDTIDKKQIAYVQADPPIPSPSGTFASPHEPTLQPKACKRACQPIPPRRTKKRQHFDCKYCVYLTTK